MGDYFNIYLIKRTKIAEPNHFLKRQDLPDFACFDVGSDWCHGVVEFNTWCKNNYLMIRLLLKQLKILDYDSEYLRIDISDLKELRSNLEAVLSDNEQEYEHEDAQYGIKIIDRTLDKYHRHHAIIVNYG